MPIIIRLCALCRAVLVTSVPSLNARMVYMALITAMVLRARSQDLLLLMSVCGVEFSTTGFKGGGKPRHTAGGTRL